ncbi:MAG: 3-oxoacid CoA-transferase [Leptospiraceae bacterium]|nr:3-oxoacid CoA-transferase [Leptospiraceae bacterium]MCP5496132.1 3-oxoacid CoA-transferase [Leptospiraceae bacterium]
MKKDVLIFKNPDDMLAEFVQPNTHIHISATIGRPNVLINSLARVFTGKNPEFTISTVAFHSTAHVLTLRKLMKKAITGFLGDNYPKPSPNRLYMKILNKEPFEVELWSLLSFIQRLMAGAQHIPYFVTRSLLDSDLFWDKLNKSVFVVPDPDNPEQNLVLIRAMTPDLTFVHGVCADENGNIVLPQPMGEGNWGALAARGGVIATVEKFVPADKIPPEYIHIPGVCVNAVCEAKFGAHPQSLRVPLALKNISEFSDIFSYRDDYSFICEAATVGDSDVAAQAFEMMWVNVGHEIYTDLLGEDRLAALKKTQKIRNKRLSQAPPNESEQMIIIASRAIVEHVMQRHYSTILAGIGAAHMAAWCAAYLLERKNIKVKVMAELGFYGVLPHYGDIFLFSQLHADRSEQLSDIVQILGTLVPKDCLGVLGLAEIDRFGNINSTRLPNGKFMVGSGGANDIASTADCLVVGKAIKSRFVEKVSYVTSPGKNVFQVVCQFGRFTRENGNSDYQLTHFLPSPFDPDINAKDAVEKYTGWQAYTHEPIMEAPPSQDELDILRRLDPDKIFLG